MWRLSVLSHSDRSRQGAVRAGAVRLCVCVSVCTCAYPCAWARVFLTAFVKDSVPAVERALAYVHSHLSQKNLYVEDPALANATAFALRVTYWKDSDILARLGGGGNGELATVHPAVCGLCVS